MCLCHKLLYQLLIAGSLIVATPDAKPQSTRDIIFPDIDRFDECYIDAAKLVQGTCKKLSDCPSALERWNQANVPPQTCYFNKFDQIVCCEKEAAPIIEPVVDTPPTVDARRSEIECESYYSFRIEVVHGEPTLPKEFPYMAALGWKSNLDGTILYRCGGVLISKKFVLTAAHCTEMGGESPIAVRLGGVNLTDVSAKDVEIKRITVHPGYNAPSTYNDIALLELIDEVGQLLKASLFLVANDICRSHYAPDTKVLQQGIESAQICAGDPDHLRDTCQGDSGGPIIIKVQRDTLMSYVVGITSFGQGCAGEPPSIYTRTSSYIDWIEGIVWPGVDIRNTS